MNYRDAIEFFLAGANAISIGTANLINPWVAREVIDGIKEYIKTKGYGSIKEIIGKVRIPSL
jgi:dihydroorotate dehydrogenase (NAD+) catalytic subunit